MLVWIMKKAEDIIDIMTNECIVYDSDEAYICKPFIDNAVIQDLNERALDEVRTAEKGRGYYRYYGKEKFIEMIKNKGVI